jgi:hypothetical protein
MPRPITAGHKPDERPWRLRRPHVPATVHSVARVRPHRLPVWQQTMRSGLGSGHLPGWPARWAIQSSSRRPVVLRPFRAHSGEPSHAGTLADKLALVSVEEDVPRLPPGQRLGLLHGAGEHRHECPEPAGHRPRRDVPPRAKRSQRCMAVRRSGRRTSICVRASMYGASGPGHMRWISMNAARWSGKSALRSLLTALDEPLPPACTDACSLAT